MSSSDLQYCLYSTGKSPGLPGRGPFLFCFLVFSRFRPGLSCSPSGGLRPGGLRPKQVKNRRFGTKFVGQRGWESRMWGDPGRFPGYRARKREKFVPNLENPFSLGRMGGQARKQGRFSIKEEAVTGMWLAPSFKKILMVLTYDFFRTFSAFCREPELPSG